MKLIRNIIRVIPPVILLSDGIALIFSYTDIFLEFMWFHSEITGHSLITVFYMAYFSYRFKACYYTWASISAMALLNVLNLIYFFVPLDYYKIYASVIVFSGLIMTLFYVLKRPDR